MILPNELIRIRRSLVWLLTSMPLQLFCLYINFVAGILAVNTLVFCLWRIPPLHHFMSRYFQSSAGRKGNEVVILCIDP